MDTQEFIAKARKIHGNSYSYDKSVYVKSNIKLSITCSKHGDFVKTPNAHLSGKQGCPECTNERLSAQLRMTTEEFIKRANEIHQGNYDYSKAIYGKNAYEPITIICPVHGDFQQTPNKHLHQRHGCPVCGARGADPYSLDDFVTAARKTHGDKYEYHEYYRSKVPVRITCPKHGDFLQLPNNHVNGAGCPECGLESSSTAQLYTREKVEEVFKLCYGSKIVPGAYTGARSSMEATCSIHGKFNRTATELLTGNGCPGCATKSAPQESLSDYLVQLGVDFKENYRELIPPYEVDFYLPEYKLAIEVNGLYWHSSKFKSKEYHRMKHGACEALGVQLIQLWDIEIGELAFSMIASKLGKLNARIAARKTSIVPLPSKIYRDFLDNNHIQGKIASSERKGLMYKDELVAVMGFSRGTMLDRFASKKFSTVVGGFSKLLSSFNKKNIISFSANRYSEGAVYKKNGFILERENPYTLYYTDGNKLMSRNQFQRHKLNIPEEMSTEDYLSSIGIHAIYGAGTKKWRKKP